MMLRAELDLGVATHTGLVRGANEDDYLLVALPGGGELIAVADGMGGAAGGAEASRAALRALGAALVAADGSDGEAAMRAGFAAACQRVFALSREVPTLRDMGTTLTAILLLGQGAVLGHVGDSRALLLRDGTLSPLTSDHAVRAPDSYLTRCIGGGQGNEEPDLSRLDLRPGDRLLLLTDGVWNTVEEPALLAVLDRLPAQAAAEELVHLANAAGGPDNATAVVVHWREPEGGPREVRLPREEGPRAAAIDRQGDRLVPPRWPILAFAVAGALLVVTLLRVVWGIDALAWLAGRT